MVGLSLGLGLGLSRSGGAPSPSYSAEATALFARMTSQPDATRKGHINTLIEALKTAGVWVKQDALYLMAAHDAQAARLNWIADQYNLSAINSPSFTVDQGYTGDGSSSYLSPGIDPTGLTRFQRDSANFSGWCRSEVNATLPLGGTAAGAPNIQIYPRTSGLLNGRANDATSLTVAVASSVGLSAVNRSGATAKQIRRNGVEQASAATASLAVVSTSLYFLRNSSIHASIQIAYGSVGASLSDAEELARHNAVLAYLTAIGAA